MFRELLAAWRKTDPLKEMYEGLIKMIEAGEWMFNAAWSAAKEGDVRPEVKEEIYRRDVEVNRTERGISRRIVERHSVQPGVDVLFDADVHKMTVTNALGCGQQKGYSETYRGVIHEVNLLKKVKLEIAVNEDFVKATVEAIIKGARTGKIGDGKIFILDLPECIKIRTGESGI